MTVGFIGLGVMGRPMAARLVAGGHHVVGLNRRGAAGRESAGAGIHLAESVAETSAGAELVITMLPDDAAVEEVALGEGGVLDSAKPGTLLVDMSTISPATVGRIAAAARSRGVGVLDAPVSGGEVGAQSGRLSIMVGGDPAHLAAAMPVLQCLGERVTHVGPVGSGQVVKAANQLIVGGTIALLSEAIALLVACETDIEPALQALGAGWAGSRLLEAKARDMAAQNFTPGARVQLHNKDFEVVLSLAAERGVALPVAGLVAQLMRATQSQLGPDVDHTAMVAVLARLSGLDEW